ncbi:hypothetical protein XENORESO_017094, partial [Xenotaenia resolanae]
VGSWAAPSLDHLKPPSNVGPISPLSLFLPVASVSAHWWFSMYGAGYKGMCSLTPHGCLMGPGPPGSVGPLLGGGVPLVLGSLGPWLVHGWWWSSLGSQTPLDGSDLLCVCLVSWGAGLWPLTPAIEYSYGEPLCTQAHSNIHPRVWIQVFTYTQLYVLSFSLSVSIETAF